ncbi:MAG: hypothetical protein QGG42_00315 [Phycisphaerae bacterium]|nr:hypothetical protein [Phycisphaerae bacterium]
MIDKNAESGVQRPRKRWRKTKWFYGIVLAYLAVTIVAGIWWSAYSHRKFNEAVDPIIARGEPLAWSDFATDPIPDDQNAAILYRQAVETPLLKNHESLSEGKLLAVADTRGNELMDMLEDFVREPEVRREHPQDVRELLKMAADVFTLCRKARRLDKADWGIDFDRIAIGFTGPPGLWLYRDIAYLLSLAAIEAHESGHDDEAIEYLRDGVAMSDSLAMMPSTLTYLTSIGTLAIVNKPLEVILPDLKIGDAPGSVRPENLRGLMSELLDTGPSSQGVTLAMMGVRSEGYEISRRVLSSDMSAGQINADSVDGFYGGVSRSDGVLVRWCFDSLMAPVLRLDAAWGVRHSDEFVRVSIAGTAPEFRRGILPAQRDAAERLEGNMLLKPLSSLFAPSLDRVYVYHYGILASRRMSAAAIAVRMYQVDHGRRPETLGDLVPDYLAEVPQDPMDEPGRTIRYANDPDMPRIYSVGADGADDGGSYDDLGDYEQDPKELLFFLSGRPKRPREKSDADTEDNDDSDR